MLGDVVFKNIDKEKTTTIMAFLNHYSPIGFTNWNDVPLELITTSAIFIATNCPIWMNVYKNRKLSPWSFYDILIHTISHESLHEVIIKIDLKATSLFDSFLDVNGGFFDEYGKIGVSHVPMYEGAMKERNIFIRLFRRVRYSLTLVGKSRHKTTRKHNSMGVAADTKMGAGTRKRGLTPPPRGGGACALA